MRRLLLIPATIVLTAAGGMALCAALHKNAHVAEMSIAALAALLASVAAITPLWIARHATQLGMSQAALVATMVHLFVAIALAAIVVLGHFPLHAAFLIWLCAFYWMTLIALAMTAVRMIKTAAPAPTAQKA
jgi:hypothetical protein